MITVLQISLFLILLLVIYQDLHQRTIHVLLPIAMFLVGITYNYYSHYLDFENLLTNILFVLFIVVCLVLYTSIKSMKMINPIDTQIGIGDIAFFIALTPFFQSYSFIVFFVIGLIFSLIIYLLNTIFKKVETIPLAGYLAVFLVLNMVSHLTFNKSFLF